MSCHSRYAAVAVASLFCLPGGEAHAEGPRVELTPFAGYRLGGSFDIVDTQAATNKSVDLADETSFGLDLGLYRDPTSFYELLYSQQQTHLDTQDPALHGLDVKVEYLHFGGTLLFPEDQSWLVPYLSLTVGGTRLAATSGHYDSETKFSASLGGGLRLPFNDNVAANLGLRGYVTFVSSSSEFFCVSGVNGASCLLKASGSTFFQGEALLGLTVRF
jgi:hypothetical protein